MSKSWIDRRWALGPHATRFRLGVSRWFGWARSRVMVLILAIAISTGLGTTVATAIGPTLAPLASPSAAAEVDPSAGNLAAVQRPDPDGAIDPVEPKYIGGRDLYLQACATCHVGIPPAVFPDSTWQALLSDRQHYGMRIKPPEGLDLQQIWFYLQQYSRAIEQGDSVPYRFNQSSYFRALHPNVELPKPTQVSTCVTCHPRAEFFNFRLRSANWQD